MEAVAADRSRAGRNEGCAAEVGEGGFGVQAVGVVAGGGSEQLGGDVGADAK